ncbi:hypothetical protein ARMGADRAFT_944786 [Armillaria gallica]|uniref:Uncharacterized protein n=1 Tax=Armillaria gallica TaxID=47427 RepID=A0A2H3D5G4_ARMGA|nr:hypothetical protein ARMGADRAFT_944786 [Armillaria gallica]
MQQINIFLQSWKTSSTKLPDDLKILIKTVQKYNVCLDGLALSQSILWDMPIWYHIKLKATRWLFNSGEHVKCLKIRHGIRTVGDTEKLARYLSEDRHRERGRCVCSACTHAREQLGCRSPRKCFQKARSMIRSLPPKWNPLLDPPTELPRDNDADKERDGNTSTFKPHLITMGTITDACRIFTDDNECHNVYNGFGNEPTTPGEVQQSTLMVQP